MKSFVVLVDDLSYGGSEATPITEVESQRPLPVQVLAHVDPCDLPHHEAGQQHIEL